MSHEPTDVLFAAYLYPDPARLDFQAVLVAGVRIDGAVCLSRDDAGEVRLEGGLAELANLGLDDKIAKQARETIPSGGAGLIVAYPRSSADTLDKALTRTVRRTVGETDGKQVDALKKALTEAQEKMTRRPAWSAVNTP